MPYTPPSGNVVALNFGPPYTPPNGGVVVLEFAPPSGVEQVVVTLGFNSAAFGPGVIWNWDTQVSPPGIAAPSPGGAAAVWNWQTFVHISGFSAQAFGAPWVAEGTRYILTAGIAPPAVGQPTAINRNRYILAGGIPAPSLVGQAHTVGHFGRDIKPGGLLASLFGVATATHGVRLVSPGGVPAPEAGVAWASLSPRVIEPEGLGSDLVGRPAVGGSQSIQPAGFDASRFGERIIPESQTIYVQGFREQWGSARAFNWLTRVSPPGFHSTGQEHYRYGRADAYNLRQYISQVYDPNDGLNPPGWSQWTAVENRNRVVGAVGSAMGRFGRAEVANNARLIVPSGVPAADGLVSEYERRGLVSHFVRTVSADGIEPIPISTWGVVHNAARVLGAVGEDLSLHGSASIENTRRYFDRIGGIVPAEPGTPFVAFAVRTLSFEARYGIAPPSIPLPEVKLRTRYVSAIGQAHDRVGMPDLSIHWNIIGPRWAHRDLMGSPALRKVTPEIEVFGACAELFGDAVVRLQFRRVEAAGGDMAIIPKPRISDTRQQIEVSGANYLRVSDKLRLTRVGGPPDPPRKVAPDGISPLFLAVGQPTINEQRILPEGIYVAQQFGTCTLRTPSAIAQGFNATEIGAHSVSMRHRRIEVEGIDATVAVGRPVLSPHTIWAVVEAPEQAKRNHNATSLHYVGEEPDPANPPQNYPPGARLGRPGIGHRVRFISPKWPNHDDQYRFGSADVTHRTQVIGPDGFRPFRMGWVRVGDGSQEVVQYGSHDSAEMGSPAVLRAPYLGPQTIQPAGISPMSITGPWVSNFIRSLDGIGGFEATQMGASGEDSPYQWKRLHVGRPMPTIPAGFNAEAFGATWVSLRVRELAVSGFDAFSSEYSPISFRERMTVRRGAGGGGGGTRPPARALLPLSIVPPASSGVPNIWPGAQYIRPDGNADQFRKGAF